MATRKFWVVMGTGVLSHSPFRYMSESAAFREAERLTRMHGGTFFVLEAKGASARTDIQTLKFEESEEIPF